MTIPGSLRALLTNLIDYAGLFPPASLSMQQAVENYESYLSGREAWALARFIVPVARFAEFESAIGNIRMVEPWGISALLGSSPESDLAEIDKFNNRNQGRAIVDAVEVKASTPDEVCHIRAFVRGSLTCYFEIPLDNPGQLLPTINAIHGRAKIRTGGVTPNAFPSAESVAHFLIECERHDVAFKATAGLHHPIRCVKPLTYEPDAQTSIMHGFLNVFLAAIFAHQHAPSEGVCEILETRNEDEFSFHQNTLDWREHSVSAVHIEEARRNFAISFGSCSFEDPFFDMRELNIL